MNTPNNNKYKIGEISKILDIPIDTLRYFEKQGIVKPAVDQGNNYRYYDAWDMNYLIEYKYYRSLEFSMSEVTEIQQTDNLSALIKKEQQQQEYFRNRKLYYTYLEEAHRHSLNTLKQIPYRLNQIYIRPLEATDYFIHRIDYEYRTVAQNDGLLPAWWESFAFLNRMLYISEDRLKEGIDCYEGGFSISTHWADTLKIPRNIRTYHLPASDVLCTVIRFGGKRSFSLKRLKPLLTYIEQNHISVSNNIYANLLARTHESDGYARYIEFFIPIKQPE